MKKSLMIVSLLLLALLPSVYSASEPSLVSSFTINTSEFNDYVYAGSRMDAWASGSALYYRSGGNNYISTLSYEHYNSPFGNGVFHWEIYSESGSLLHEELLDDSINCGSAGGESTSHSPKLIYDDAGNMIIFIDTVCGGTKYSRSFIYDIRDLGFLEQRYAGSVGGTSGANLLLSSNGDDIKYFDGWYAVKTNVTNDTMSAFNEGLFSAIQKPHYYPNELIDWNNDVFVTDSGETKFYMTDGTMQNWDNWNTQTLIGEVEANRGFVVDWNRNFRNPEYITSEGHIVLVGGSDYDDFRTSSNGLDFDEYFFFERDNIVGVKDNKWAYADMTEIGNPIVTYTNTPVNADLIQRVDNNENRLMTYNHSTGTFKIYEVPRPSFIDEEETGVNTAPSKSLDLLGIDNNGRFIFTAEFTDAEGGIISQALSVGFSTDILDEQSVRETIRGDRNPEKVISSCPDYTTFNLYEGRGDDAGLDFFNTVDMASAGETCTLQHDYNPVTIADTDIVTLRGSFAIDSDGSESEGASIGVSDGNYNYPLILTFSTNHYDGQPSNVSISANGLGSYLVEEVAVNGGENTFYEYDLVFDFSTQEVTVSIWEYVDYDDVSLGRDYILSNYTLNFYQESYGVSNVYFNQISTIHTAKIGEGSLSYDNVAQTFPEYEVVGDLGAGETVIELLRSEGNHDYGTQRALLYSTDDTLGLNYYENPFQLTFNYDETIQQLTEDEIQQAYSDALTGASGGFTTPNFIEGDLVTDTIFGYLDTWNIKSTASKFMVGLGIIILLIALGGFAGSVANSTVASGLGAIFGGVGGLFLVTYWGLFPLWVTFTITLITLGLVANVIRNIFTGSGGS